MSLFPESGLIVRVLESPSTVRATSPAPTLALEATKVKVPAVVKAVAGAQVTVPEAPFAISVRLVHVKATLSPLDGCKDNPLTAPDKALSSAAFPFVIVIVIESVVAKDFFVKSAAIFPTQDAAQFEKDINDIINII